MQQIVIANNGRCFHIKNDGEGLSASVVLSSYKPDAMSTFFLPRIVAIYVCPARHTYLNNHCPTRPRLCFTPSHPEKTPLHKPEKIYFCKTGNTTRKSLLLQSVTPPTRNQNHTQTIFFSGERPKAPILSARLVIITHRKHHPDEGTGPVDKGLPWPPKTLLCLPPVNLKHE